MAMNATDVAAYTRRSAGDAVGAKADAEILNCINAATFMLASERQWPWLHRRGFLNFLAPYSTGTVTLTSASTTLTGSGSTFPYATMLAPFSLYIKSRILDMTSMSSGTAGVLAQTWGEATEAALTYTLFKDSYALPENLLSFGNFLPGQSWASEMEYMDPDQFWIRQNDIPISQEFPDCYTIQGDYINVWPWPSEAKTIAYSYYAQPTPLTAITSGTLDWPTGHKVLLEVAIDVMVARRFGKCLVGDFNAAYAIYRSMLATVGIEQRGAKNLPSMSELVIGGRGNRRPPPWKALS